MIGHGYKVRCLVDICRLIGKSAGDKTLIPQMAPDDKSQRYRLRYWVERNPNADVVHAVDAVVGVVVVPWGHLTCLGFFYKHMFVKHAHSLSFHEVERSHWN